LVFGFKTTCRSVAKERIAVKLKNATFSFLMKHFINLIRIGLISILFLLFTGFIAFADSFTSLTVIQFYAHKLDFHREIPIDLVRVVVFTNGGFSPIPFQIDKRGKKGKYLFPGEKEFDRKTLSPHDEFVMQGDDLGEKATGAALPALPGAIEIEVTLHGKKGYAYVGTFPIEKNPADYVRFAPENSGVVTPLYDVGCYPGNATFFDRIAMGGVDHLDRVKLRASASLFYGKVRIDRNEEDIRSKKVEVVDGPVRVLQRIEYSVRMVAGIHSPTLSRVTKSYKSVYLIPNRMRVPFNMERFFTDLRTTAAYDFDPTIAGAKIYCSNCGNGFLVNGKMDDFEFSETGLGSRNMALCSPHGTLMTSIKTNEKVDVLNVQTGGFYKDDQSVMDRPESIPGMFGTFGYRLENLHKVPKGVYDFYLAMLFPDECPDPDKILDVANEYWDSYELRFRSGKALYAE
jgi:hypothetical protein